PRRFDLLSDIVSPVIPGARVLEPSPSRPGFAEPAPRWNGAPPADAGAPLPRDANPEERRARFRLIRNDKPPRRPGPRP
ncbi:hypothetical protein ACDP63_07540, partial [Paracoccus sp. P2]